MADWEKLIALYDKSNIVAFQQDFPKQCGKAFELGKKAIVPEKEVKNIIAAGMGGSGVGAFFLKNILKSELKVPFDITHSYELPEFVGTSTLALVVSFSGNTEETISCFKDAKKRGAMVVSVCSGGELQKLDEKAIVVPKVPQPRYAVAFVSLPMLGVLQNKGLVGEKDKEINAMVSFLESAREEINEKAKEIAEKLKGKFPLIYAPTELEAVAYRWQCDLNENSKIFAHHHVIPEMNHNELNAFKGLENGEIVLLRSKNESERIRKRMDFTKKTLGEKFPVSEVLIEGSSLLERTFYAVWLGTLLSTYLGLVQGFDPVPIPTISKLKKELKK